MNTFNRRQFLAFSGAASLTLSGCANMAQRSNGARVVIVGGGFGGATAAKYLRRIDPKIQVTLIESNTAHVTCPGSNWVLGSLRNMESITFSYDQLRNRHGVNVVQDTVTAIDPIAHKVMTAGGNRFTYDRLILSPGISFKNNIEGYTEEAMQVMPHAWKAGPQTVLLHQQLEAMDDGGTVIIVSPPNPFRCPPGPYERASMIAHYLSVSKPRSKILILDAKEKFSKQGLFTEGWQTLYGYNTKKSLIEWRSLSNDGKVVAVDPKAMTVQTEFGETIKGDVINVIPAQKASDLLTTAGLTDDSGWCPVEHSTWESKLQPDVHIIGDACIAGSMPKSGFAANSQGKVCAVAVSNLLNGREALSPNWVNTCYSLVGPQYGISVAMVYKLNKEGIATNVEGAGGISPANGNRQLEAVYADSWYNNITDDIFN